MKRHTPVKEVEKIVSPIIVQSVRVNFYESSHWLVQFWGAKHIPKHVPNNLKEYLEFSNPDGTIVKAYAGDYVIRNNKQISVYSSQEFKERFKTHRPRSVG